MSDVYLTRDFLDRVEKTYLLKNKNNQADVYVIEFGGKKVVVKDYSRRKGWAKLLGILLSKYEFSNYKKVNQLLHGECFPEVYGRPDRFSFAMEFVDGKTFDLLKGMESYCYAIDKLMQCLKKMHSKGIFHLDLRKKSNIIVADDLIYIIDLTSMIVLSAFSPLFFLKPILRMVDESSVLKLKQFICPSRLTDNEIKKLKLYQWIRALWIFNKPKLPRKITRS